ncbi:HAMP domain-containing sensor histidine kinase [Brevundimonas sp.]|uniref:sensor histidine kinase n=1 Tax=Brevundimonas sp. TaxID=1871086 RepID=UPI0025DC86E0|nr:HAMP domain-containing sensor histidine kinase [Brevundimonas sp.]
MIPSSPAAEAPSGSGSDRPAALWHLGWSLACALLLAGVLGGGLAGGASVAFALGAAGLPGLVGQGLWFAQGPRTRLALGAAWAAGVLVCLMLSGGLTGPFGIWVLAPLVAGLTFGRDRERALGATGSLAAAAVGLAAAVSWPIPPLPYLAFLSAVILTGLAAVALLRSRGAAERHGAEEAEARHRLERILAAQPFLSLVLDAEGRVLAAFGRPPQGLEVADLTEEGLVGSAHAPDRPLLMQALKLGQEGAEAEARFAPRRAIDRQVRATVRPTPDGRLLAVLADVTAQQAREAALEAARAEAEALHQGKSRFLANMSHELRTPLNAVLGFSDIMRQRMFGPLPERYLEYATLIHEAGGHLLDLINDVLDMSKIEAERFELSRERFDAREPASAALRLMRLQAYDKDIDLRAALPADPVMVEADKRALKQMILNLLSNAVKFTPRKGSVTLTLEARGGVLEFSVADTGVGVSPADLERLGRPYEQVGDNEKRAMGTGLGLSLVRAMAELHGGRMGVESTLGEGSVFTVRLPVVEAAPRPSGEVVPFPGPAAANSD